MFGTAAWKIVSNSPEILRKFNHQTWASSSDESLIPSVAKGPDRCPESSLEIPSVAKEPERRLKSLLEIPSEAKGLDRRLKSSLESLPVELLQSISGYLSLSSVASLAFCNHHMNHVIGRQSWSGLWTQRSEKIIFLSYLEKDLPDQRLCHRCLKLHGKVPADDLQLTQSAPEEPGMERRSDVAYSYPPINLTLQQVQSALNRHHFGSEQGLSLDFFHRPLPKGPLGLCRRPSTKARIVADEFILRSTYWIPKWPDRPCTVHKRDNPIRLCPHIAIYYGDKLIMDLTECQFHHRKGVPCYDCKSRKNCRSCSTEFDVELRSGKAGLRALYITTWRNFGCGRSTKYEKWQQHVWSEEIAMMNDYNFFARGTIRLAYESRQTNASKETEHERELDNLFFDVKRR